MEDLILCAFCDVLVVNDLELSGPKSPFRTLLGEAPCPVS